MPLTLPLPHATGAQAQQDGIQPSTRLILLLIHSKDVRCPEGQYAQMGCYLRLLLLFVAMCFAVSTCLRPVRVTKQVLRVLAVIWSAGAVVLFASARQWTRVPSREMGRAVITQDVFREGRGGRGRAGGRPSVRGIEGERERRRERGDLGASRQHS